MYTNVILNMRNRINHWSRVNRGNFKPVLTGFRLMISSSILPSISDSNRFKSFSLNRLFLMNSCSLTYLETYSRGAIEISRTALNSPQLLRCSFSSRKKFQTKRLNISNNPKAVVSTECPIADSQTLLFKK